MTLSGIETWFKNAIAAILREITGAENTVATDLNFDHLAELFRELETQLSPEAEHLLKVAIELEAKALAVVKEVKTAAEAAATNLLADEQIFRDLKGALDILAKHPITSGKLPPAA